MSDGAGGSCGGSSDQSQSARNHAIASDFLKSYPMQMDFWRQAAAWLEGYVRTSLVAEGIQAIVSSRAKSPDRLEIKLKGRAADSKTQWHSEQNMLNELADIAGVRVALYIPSNRLRAVQALQSAEHVEVIKLKEFARNKESQVSGEAELDESSYYAASHLRVRLVGLPEQFQHYELAHCIEIQVASLLMHSWAEVGHDLLYKPLKGTVSKDEKECAISANTLMLLAEKQLDQMEAHTQRRIQDAEESRQPFKDHYELATWLRTQAQACYKDEHLPMGDCDEAFEFMKSYGMDVAPHELSQFMQIMFGKEQKQLLATTGLATCLGYTINANAFEQWLDEDRSSGTSQTAPKASKKAKTRSASKNSAEKARLGLSRSRSKPSQSDNHQTKKVTKK